MRLCLSYHLFMIVSERIYKWQFKSPNTTAGVTVNNACSTQVKYSSVACCLWGGRGRIFCVYCSVFYSAAFQGGRPAILFCLLFIWEKKKSSSICTHIGACKLSIQHVGLSVWIKGSSTVVIEEECLLLFHSLQLYFGVRYEESNQ